MCQMSECVREALVSYTYTNLLGSVYASWPPSITDKWRKQEQKQKMLRNMKVVFTMVLLLKVQRKLQYLFSFSQYNILGWKDPNCNDKGQLYCSRSSQDQFQMSILWFSFLIVFVCASCLQKLGKATIFSFHLSANAIIAKVQSS